MTYPKYLKSRAYNIKLISENLSVWVSEDRIEKGEGLGNFINQRDDPESTETEFKKAFNKTSKYLKSLI